ncbi:hypothetical protein BST43_21895 [Mycobacteroides saopaulense]|uniref:Glutamyl-tRNA amidotransferase n=1 Tax=Mycobacteroides saopaulense TaxID=1578165 RepID=A0A1S4W167_9MYCO|nr:hypothetical protein [Mycobacteroides saopaulense]ALR14193.1 hypothetical protein MYCSP_13340 [Mycobacteroides saopaulense]ORB50635.1 hypothetical protein BST43_21895 [Mycobacteroides saopaulense]
MTSTHDPHALRATMRVDLAAALKARNSQAVSALRTTIAAIDNAESVDDTTETTPGSTHIAGAAMGLGAAEAPRRVLSPADVRAVVRAQIEDRTAQADRYEALGQAQAAAQLRGEAQILADYL